MGEILPDGTYQNYFRKCKICGKTIETNIQGDELDKHSCGVKPKDTKKWKRDHGIGDGPIVLDVMK